MVELVYLFKDALSNNDIRLCGQLIDESWSLKKLLSSNISNELIDKAYILAKNNGAYGGKILGAGYGGFLMIIADKVDHNRIKKALDYLTSYSFKFENSGSTIVYNDN
jgi:D-glycero-alpha-D-manno-heptose-7-phosphate kinase